MDGHQNASVIQSQEATLQGSARRTDRQQRADPCLATTQAACCPVTIEASNAGAVDNLNQAVAMYRARCNPDCAGGICQPVPSRDCVPLPGSVSQGRCR